LQLYRLTVRPPSGIFFFTGSGGGRLGLRFSRGPRALTALRPGEGPRAVGFSMLLALVVEAFVSNAYPIRRLAQAPPQRFRLTGAAVFPG
jgi:hypothetical protein